MTDNNNDNKSSDNSSTGAFPLIFFFFCLPRQWTVATAHMHCFRNKIKRDSWSTNNSNNNNNSDNSKVSDSEPEICCFRRKFCRAHMYKITRILGTNYREYRFPGSKHKTVETRPALWTNPVQRFLLEPAKILLEVETFLLEVGSVNGVSTLTVEVETSFNTFCWKLKLFCWKLKLFV